MSLMQASELSKLADELRNGARNLRASGLLTTSSEQAASEEIAGLGSYWGGPSADRILGVASDYVGKMAGAGAHMMATADSLDLLAQEADNIAGELTVLNTRLDDAVTSYGSLPEEERQRTAGQQYARVSSIENQIDFQLDAWNTATRTFDNRVSDPVGALTRIKDTQVSLPDPRYESYDAILAEMNGMSEEELAVYWRLLSPAQQERLLSDYADDLLAIGNLPDDVLDAAKEDPDKAVLSRAEQMLFEREYEALSDAERAAFDDAIAEARSPVEADILRSALATGAGVGAALTFATRLQEMSPEELQAVASLTLADVDRAGTGDTYARQSNPDGTTIRLTLPDGTVLRQQTSTTCGPTVLLMLAVQRDPYLAHYIANGELVDGHVPAYIDDLDLGDAQAASSPGDRFETLQRNVLSRINNGTWVDSLGSAPWNLGGELARIHGSNVLHIWRPVGPLNAAESTEYVTAAIESVDDGDPVPFLVGNTAVPLHYVLLVGHHDGVLQFYDPASGQIREASADDVMQSDTSDISSREWLYGMWMPERHSPDVVWS